MIINYEIHQVCALTIFETSTDTLTADVIKKEAEKNYKLAQIKGEF